MSKKISSRGIIIEDNYIYTMFRRKIIDGVVFEYYVIPGGKVEKDETLIETLIRELKEEFSVDIDILEYVGKNENDTSIAYFYKCNIKSGIPRLGGEEKERCSKENYYEIRKVKITEIENINIFPKDLILNVISSTIKTNPND